MGRLRLVNRSSLGIQRAFRAFHVEGKEPPLIQCLGDGVRVSLRASDLSVPFRTFVAEEAKGGVDLPVDHLLILPLAISTCAMARRQGDEMNR